MGSGNGVCTIQACQATDRDARACLFKPGCRPSYIQSMVQACLHHFIAEVQSPLARFAIWISLARIPVGIEATRKACPVDLLSHIHIHGSFNVWMKLNLAGDTIVAVLARPSPLQPRTTSSPHWSISPQGAAEASCSPRKRSSQSEITAGIM